ncbi:hypothetical protein BHE74_00044180 [Ensete ventricosum]|nr:hypothetical protein GW17_00011467 [Ensete ventricosum]RWW49617.1 hypothetical protein BHE74_00044180 [Ensete ventricosum]
MFWNLHRGPSYSSFSLAPHASSPLPRCHETSSDRRNLAAFPQFLLSRPNRFVQALVSRGLPRLLHDATQSMVGNFSLILILFLVLSCVI